VFRSDTDLAVIPLENTIHGVVQETLRCFCEEADAESSKMAQSRWEIVGDTDLAVQHALVVRKGTKLEDVTWVGSHEQVRTDGSRTIVYSLT
jgi:prephenate dehydratase